MGNYILFWLSKAIAELLFVFGFVVVLAVIGVVLAVYDAKQSARRKER